MQEVVLFIPRILPNVSKKNIIDRFAELQIGSVTNIQSANRVNENKNRYWFAFITVKLWETPEGCHFWNQVIVDKETIRIEYFTPFKNSTKLPVTDLNIAPQMGADSNLHRYKNGFTKYLYWEIQLCNKNNTHLKDIQKNETFEATKKPKVVESVSIPSICDLELEEGEIYESSFTVKDHLYMYQDYLELERCIFGSNYLCM
jgi:hypothetical protein